MYAKILKPSPAPGMPAVPMICITVNGAQTIEALHERGWSTYGNTVQDPDAEVHIELTGITLQIAGLEVLRDTNGDSQAPDGWWPAVQAVQDQCMIVFADEAVLDLRATNVGERFVALLDSTKSAAALAKITT